MIALDSDYLLFQLVSGESVPLSSDMISIEVSGDGGMFDEEFLQQATASVFHYFKTELGKQIVTVGEFAGALEKILRGFAMNPPPAIPKTNREISEFDLRLIAGESGAGCDLFFFPRLRDELRAQLALSPRLLRFRGLRACVKQMTGAQRWSPSCQRLRDRIVEFLRSCLTTDGEKNSCALLVD